MTQDDRIDKLESRVDRLETSIDEKLSKIFDKLNALTVDGIKSACPAPGSCLSLSAELKNQIQFLTATTSRVERLELRMMALEKWQGRILGGISVFLVLFTFFGDTIKHFLRIP